MYLYDELVVITYLQRKQRETPELKWEKRFQIQKI